MGRRYEIREEQWEKIKDKLPCQPGYQGKGVDNPFVPQCGDVCSQVRHTPGRDLPERFGSCNTVCVRFRRWAKAGVWQRIFKDLSDRDVKTLLIDSTAIRVHQHGAGALKKREAGNKHSEEAMGRSRGGGLTTQLHLSTDEKGRIKEMLLTGGQTADVKMSLELMTDLKPKKAVAGKACDADWFLFYLDSESIEAVIPSKRSRLQKRTIDYKTHKERNVIERTISRLRQYRKIATRYEKTITSFLALCCLAATFINLNL